MVIRKAVVLYTNPLFGEGLACLLESEQTLRLPRVDARRPEAPAQIRQLHPDAIIIVEGDAREVEVLDLFKEAPDALIVRVVLGDNAVDMYRNRHVDIASLEDLREAINGLGKRKSDRSPRCHPG
ncbi:MAG: hypothetical protein IT307_06590 [Chloroflexi bacterium]|nr:hypothetical protein [Chloroflexota bacterium]